MPTDVAPPLSLSQEDFAYGPAPRARSPVVCRRERQAKKTKKRVTFADHRGLPLARVKVFYQFKDTIRIPAGIRFESADREDDDDEDDDELVLDFAQPGGDEMLFRQSLDRTCVRLEKCVLKERTLVGTVKVKNLSFEKRVWLRVTFDSWASHSDVDCAYVEDSYPSSYADTFSFRLALPRVLDLQPRVEFAVCYQAAGAEYWDSNRGRNYRILRAKDERAGRFRFGVRPDTFGGLACGRGILPEWPGYAGYENGRPYY
ncbi:protein phosphatase 1 regulatory subunit 3B-like [Syngnathoides biaculeatus]|uniref:protein phosphatase 1 regulatory subunit 3B-like n=1 Tax=Syngnathoides biaculeatus TaxID=300417 RepID=UPI002ADD6934|nr:protein phosphatase 1 regulatory subunit 3B-like [Syngnathoides biaculeatus]